jgi:PAS domain S-box-containing protein
VQFANDIFSWHAADGSVLYISPNCRRLLGHEPAELLGQNLFRLIHPDDLANVHLARADLLAEGSPVPVTFRIANREGVWVWLEMFAPPVSTG